jgi:hypothetical protein
LAYQFRPVQLHIPGFWRQAEIYEQLKESKIQLDRTRNELDAMKQYVNEVLKEVHDKKR